MFMPLITLFSIILFTSLFFLISDKQNQFTGTFGETQVDIIHTLDETEGALLYLDQAATYALFQSIHELASRGGFESGTDCGEFSQHTRYVNEDESCYIENIDDVYDELWPIYSSQLYAYLRAHPTITFPQDYEFEMMTNGDLIGIPVSRLELPVKDYGTYSVLPSFRVPLLYDFDQFGSVVVGAKKIEKECVGVIDVEFASCVNRIIDSLPFSNSWSYLVTGRSITFDVETITLPFFDGKTTKKKPVVVRFSMTLSLSDDSDVDVSA